MGRLILVPYRMGSASVKAIKEEVIKLGHKCLRVLATSTTYRPRTSDRIVYYGGTTSLPRDTQVGSVLNKNRALACNKLHTFRTLQEAGLSTVPWTENKNEIPEDWKQIVSRATLTGHSGDGISVHNYGDYLPDVPLYTKYIKKTFECRIHVMNGQVIDGQLKKRKQGVENVNNLVRNVHTGWVYCREGFTPEVAANDLAIASCHALGLDFGAVDLIYNQHYNQYYVLEVNTAPGLTGTTLTNYVNHLTQGL